MLVIPLPVAEVIRMRLSDGTTDYFVSITCDGRQITPHVFKTRYKAEYEVAEWRYIFQGGIKPDILHYDEETFPND